MIGRYIAIRIIIATCLICVAPASHSASEWNGIGRIIAIGDVHGDYDRFVSLLQESGLVDKRNRWTGGNTHLVQTGDIADRGPDSRKVMDLLRKLEKSAAGDGGSVHVLIGNHEVMNIRNDLRYVDPGEYKAFRDRNSKRRQEMYYEQTVKYIRDTQPEEEWPEFDNAYKKDWEARYPQGYVEHRLAWAATGEYGKWVISHNAVIKINDTLFMHGGLSPAYGGMPLEEINTRARTELVDQNLLGPEALINADDGPLWYRGWATNPETPENKDLLEQVLASHGASRMVIAHTPLIPAIVPRFSGKVLVIDVGLAEHYGGGFASLQIENDEIFAIMRGSLLKIPSNAEEVVEYLTEAAALQPDPAKINNYIQSLLNPVPAEGPASGEELPVQQVSP